MGMRLLEGPVLPAPWVQRVVLPRRFVAHAAADGGRWPGLCGGCDRSGIPLLLSSVVCEPVVLEK